MEQQNIKAIEMTPELDKCLTELVETSLLSSEQALDKYRNDERFIELSNRVAKQRQMLLLNVQQLRQKHPEMTDEIFYKYAITSFLTPVIKQINNEFGELIPTENLQKLNGLVDINNIVFTFDPNQNDFQADSVKGILMINPNKTNGSMLEEKIVSSMGIAIHESFHLLINMLKTPEQAEMLGERLMYTISTSEGDKEVHFAPGRYGQVLSEGFVEKISSEFAERNGFYYTLNPSYIPYVDLCTQLMKQDSTIDYQTLFTKNADAIVERMTPDVKTKFESAERLTVINNFETKEAKKDTRLKGITSKNVKNSWLERNGEKQEVVENISFSETLSISETKTTETKTSFDYRTDGEIKVAEQIREKNQLIAQQKQQQKQQNKPKTLVKTNPNTSSTNKGYINVVVLSLIISFVAGMLFMVVYSLIR